MCSSVSAFTTCTCTQSRAVDEREKTVSKQDISGCSMVRVEMSVYNHNSLIESSRDWRFYNFE